MTYSHLAVSWDAYQKNICKGFGALQQRGEFVDMTIAADGHHVKVHQMIMSLVSPYIKELITSAQCPHPIIFLNKCSYQTMQSVLEYAYTGEVVVRQDQLREFLEACKDLQVKGLETTMKFAENTVSQMYAQKSEAKKDDSTNIHHTEVVAEEKFNSTDDETSDVNKTKLDGNIADRLQIDQNDDYNDVIMTEEGITTTEKTTNTPESIPPSFQYSLSNQANLQIVLNRFLYSLRHIRKNEQRFWRCISQQSTRCPAYVTTIGEKILERVHAHNHSFHDRQILKRVRNGNVFTALEDVENAAVAAKKRKPKTTDSEEIYIINQPLSNESQENCLSDSQ